jgi:DNA repair exonuclease SbcCD ATPase subunit
MIKKMVIGAGSLALVGLLFFGPAAWSYVRTSCGYVERAVSDSVPVEFQIDRARQMVKDIMPEVERNMRLIAREEVEVRRLEERIARLQDRLAQDKENILRLKTDLADGGTVFHYAGRDYSAEQVRGDLAARFKRFQTGEATLQSLEKMYNARQRSLDAAREKLEGMLASKRQLEVEVENLEARRQMIAAAQTTSEFQFDDSHLGRVKELIADLGARLDVADKMIAAETDFHDEIPLDEPSQENIVDQVSRYFAEPGDEPAKLAAAE